LALEALGFGKALGFGSALALTLDFGTSASGASGASGASAASTTTSCNSSGLATIVMFHCWSLDIWHPNYEDMVWPSLFPGQASIGKSNVFF
jgi:hypothetical protein